MAIPLNAKIFVAGHNGLVGSALVRALKAKGYQELILKTRSELNLLDQKAVNDFFNAYKPEYILVAAAKVGGIWANQNYPANFIYENIQIAANIIHHAYLHGVKKLLYLGSSCIYPRLCPQPMKEEYLLSGLLEPTNEPYAIAKIAGIKMCQSYNRQFGTNFISVMPTNLYGENDNFDPETSHVLPALIRKFHLAKINNEPQIKMWGTGSARREFLHVDDMTRACLLLMENYDHSDFVNIGYGQDLTIKELALLIKEIVNYQGEIKWDQTKPDGMPQKLLDSSRLLNMGWRPEIDLKTGITMLYNWYLENEDKIVKRS
jgi:GDP-L-fucose synthase